MIKILDKEKCCGCGACANACPQNCIIMEEDYEGFLYPSINESLCINCGICEKACPIINVRREIPTEQKGYIVQNKNETVLKESTSGGAFSAIAEYVIEHGGVVFGVICDDMFNVHHVKVNQVEQLSKFRNSKYVQSDTKLTFSEARTLLEAGILVCYSGTPCQIEALLQFLQKDYKTLITVDVVCRAVGSPLVLRKYIEMQRKILGQEIKNLRFRDKYYGYQYSQMTLDMVDNQAFYHNGTEADPYLRAFFSDICDRPSCYNCSFKKRYRVSDFTIWDCFRVYDYNKSFDPDIGTTSMLVHTLKGQKVFECIKDKVRYCEVDTDMLVSNAREMKHSVNKNINREAFFHDANRMNGKALFEKYFPINSKVKIVRTVRRILFKMHLYTFIRKSKGDIEIILKLKNKG